MTTDFVTVWPLALSAGTSGHASIVGGDAALSSGVDTDLTYLKVDNFELIGGSLPLSPSITFPPIEVPEGALSDFYLHVRCEQLAGSSGGQVVLFDPGNESRNVSAPRTVFVTLGDGVVEDDGIYSNGGLTFDPIDNSDIFPATGATAHTWRLDFNRSGLGACDFRIYELQMTVVWETTGGPPPLRRFPPVGNGGHGPTRHWPRTVNRRAGGTY